MHLCLHQEFNQVLEILLNLVPRKPYRRKFNAIHKSKKLNQKLTIRKQGTWAYGHCQTIFWN